MERSNRIASRQSPVGLVRLGETFLVIQLGDDCVDLGIDPLDLAQDRRS